MEFKSLALLDNIGLKKKDLRKDINILKHIQDFSATYFLEKHPLTKISNYFYQI